MQAGCDGIVVLDWRGAYGHLRHVPRVICGDEETAAKVHQWTRPARRSVKIFVQGISHSKTVVAI
jgi:hypothetical protein